MKINPMHLLFGAFMLILNSIMIIGIDHENYDFVLYNNILNVLTFPFLVLFISRTTTRSNPQKAYSKRSPEYTDKGFKAKVMEGLVFILKKPIVYILFFSPLLLGLYSFDLSSNSYADYSIQLVFSFYLGLNLFVIGIFLKFYFKYLPQFITVLGIVFISFVTVFEMTVQNLKLFTISMTVISFVVILFLHNRTKSRKQNMVNIFLEDTANQ